MSESGGYAALELEHLVGQINSLTTARIQASTFLGTANLIIFSTALSTSRAGLFLPAAAIVILAMSIDVRLRASVLADTVRGIVLQQRLSGGEADTFLQAQPLQASRLPLEIAAEPNSSIRAHRLRALSYRQASGKTAWAMCLVAAFEASCAMLAFSDSFSFF